MLVLACAAARAQPAGDDELVEEPAVRIPAPPVADVIAAAYRAGGLEHDPGQSVVRRARLAGLIPWLTVRGGKNTAWHDEDPNIARGTTFEVRATWRLDRLVFDGRELQVTAMQAARRRERRRLANRVIKAYFTWRRATMARSWSRAEEAEAELDAMTDGWFTEARRSASETRTPCNAHAATP
jgi:hypothetical protein